MAKMFYTAEEAAKRLGKTIEELQELVAEGTLREFRDGDALNYKVSDVDAIAPSDILADSGSASASGEIVLEPAEDSGIELSPTGSDILSLEEVDAGDTSSTTATGRKEDTAARKKSDTVVPSVGVNVFDDDELDEAVDPLAQTAVTDVGGLGLDGVGSGSGILDLTKESDDTSLGAELLEEIYSGEEGDSGEMGEDTRAGLEATPEEPEAVEEGAFEGDVEAGSEEAEAAEPAPVAVAAVATAAEPVADAVSAGLTALMVVALVVMWFAGLAGAGLVRGVVPSLVSGVYAHLAVFAGGALGVAVIAGAISFLLARRSK